MNVHRLLCHFVNTASGMAAYLHAYPVCLEEKIWYTVMHALNTSWELS